MSKQRRPYINLFDNKVTLKIILDLNAIETLELIENLIDHFEHIVLTENEYVLTQEKLKTILHTLNKYE